jgi:hypothetical protein
MRGEGLTWGELDRIEARLRAALVDLNKRNASVVTMIEAVDEAGVWPQGLDDFDLKSRGVELDQLIARAPLLICAVASEIGFAYEGVGTTFWAHFDEAIGDAANLGQRQHIAEIFRTQAERYRLSCPSQSAFSEHFSIIAWPIANALLPSDLVASVLRLLASAPVGALPGTGHSSNFASLRAWASAAEGARLVDWLRLEAPAARVLTALLTENRANTLPRASYQRLCDAIDKQPDTFFAARVARLRARVVKAPAPAESTPGQLSLARGVSGLRMFVTWPALSLLLSKRRGWQRARQLGDRGSGTPVACFIPIWR